MSTEAEMQEPVAYIRVSKTGNVMACAKTDDFYALPNGTLLYTHPQPKQDLGIRGGLAHDAQLKEKNT